MWHRSVEPTRVAGAGASGDARPGVVAGLTFHAVYSKLRGRDASQTATLDAITTACSTIAALKCAYMEPETCQARIMPSV